MNPIRSLLCRWSHDWGRPQLTNRVRVVETWSREGSFGDGPSRTADSVRVVFRTCRRCGASKETMA